MWAPHHLETHCLIIQIPKSRLLFLVPLTIKSRTSLNSVDNWMLLLREWCTKTQQKTRCSRGCRLRPGTATWRTGRNVRVVFDSGLHYMKTCMTSSVKPEVHNDLVLLRRQWSNKSCTSDFVDDVVFKVMERMGQNQTTRTFHPVRQMAAPGAKSVVSDCILLILVL